MSTTEHVTAAVTGRVRYRAAAIGGAVVAALGLLRVVLLVRDPSDLYIASVPDDAFYYVTLARRMAEQGSWTFDGTAPTTGFHPLYAYLLVLLHRVAGDLDARTLLVVVGTAASLALGLAAALTGITTTRLLGSATVGLVVAVFVTPLAVMQATYLMESWLVVLAAAATVCLVSAGRRPTAWGSAGIVVVGVLGSLARSDFGLLPAALVAGALITRRLTGPDPWLRRSLLALAGAVAGLGLVTLQNLVISGVLLQASVRVKAHWAQVLAGSPNADLATGASVPVSLVTGTLTPYPTIIPYAGLVWSALAVVLVLLLLRRVRSGQLPPTALTLAVGAVVAVVGYVVVYSRNADVQFWYTAAFLVPSAVLLASFGRAVLDRWLMETAVILAATYAALSLTLITQGPWANQISTKEAALALRGSYADGPVAAWSAGVLSFYSGRDVVNLDGLVDDDVVPYILDDRLADYVDARGIRYIVDAEYAFTLPAQQARGGYSDGRLEACLGTPLRTFDAPGVPSLQFVQVREVEPGCLDR